MAIKEQKDVLRRNLMQQRQLLAVTSVNDLSQKIINRLVSLVPWGKVRCLHTYVPITEKNEVDTWPLLKYVWQNQPHIMTLVPVMHKQKMLNAAVNHKTRWRKNKFGIPEPVDVSVSVLFHQFDIIIMPTLGFDKTGNRLGYGQGHYDKFLANQPHATTIGLACADAEVKLSLLIEPHDIKLDYIITEAGVLEFRTRI